MDEEGARRKSKRELGKQPEGGVVKVRPALTGGWAGSSHACPKPFGEVGCSTRTTTYFVPPSLICPPSSSGAEYQRMPDPPSAKWTR